ncbi:MAG: bacteriocin-protection protein [Chloroflexi bacterium]|nr:bacteriocin-protection protein [Chloroflexota bacterium]
MEPTFFATADDFRRWLEENSTTVGELIVGFYKTGSGIPSITWPESVDEALCFGWIDGVRKRIDDASYLIRFSPRRAGSVWSAVNIASAERLIAAGRMTPAGLKAFVARKENKSGIYSYEQRRAELEEPYNSLLQENEAAWSFFQLQPPSYRKGVSWFILSAKQEATRLKRLAKLIEVSARGERLPEFRIGEGK